MFTVALIGPDGAGKTTVSRRLEHALPHPVKYVYMGVSLDSSNHMLPTTRLVRAIKRARGLRDTAGPRDPASLDAEPKRGLRRLAAEMKSLASCALRASEEWFRQSLTWYYQARGYIVLFDRHYFLDYYVYDIANAGRRRTIGRRLHGFLLNRLFPRPDLVVYLDAPPEVLFARKGEGTIESLRRRREDYLGMGPVLAHFVVIDANRPLESVVSDVRDCIWDYYRSVQSRSASKEHVARSAVGSHSPGH